MSQALYVELIDLFGVAVATAARRIYDTARNEGYIITALDCARTAQFLLDNTRRSMP